MFRKFSFLNLVYLLAVILFGAYVRMTGAGAGCGRHWPLCNGHVVPLEPQLKTVIEYTHRLTSGLSLIFVLILFFAALRFYPKKHLVRFFASGQLFFLLVEALLGASLVLLEHVAYNSSEGRAITVGLHLINTFALLFFSAGTFYFSSFEVNVSNFRATSSDSLQVVKENRRGFMFLFLLLCIVGASGAITALGDTLFPIKEGANAFAAITPTSHLFVRLRIYHPILALGVSFYLLYFMTRFFVDKNSLRQTAAWIVFAVLIQICAGFLNIFLHAPNYLQLIHLFCADVIWILFVILYFQDGVRGKFLKS